MSTAPFIELRSDANRDVVVRVSFERTPDTRADGFHVEVDAPGLSVHETVVSWKGDGLESFFASLADDWKGWHGTRAWHALEDEMIIEASHGGRFVTCQGRPRALFDVLGFTAVISKLPLPPGGTERLFKFVVKTGGKILI